MLWLIDKILQILDTNTKIKVLVHEAFLVGQDQPKYFIKITNLSPKNIFTITHIWVKDVDEEIDILNPVKPLPHKLNSSEQWETWFDKSNIKDQKNIFKNIRVVLSNGKTYKSRKNRKVRPCGFIA